MTDNQFNYNKARHIVNSTKKLIIYFKNMKNQRGVSFLVIIIVVAIVAVIAIGGYLYFTKLCNKCPTPLWCPIKFMLCKADQTAGWEIYKNDFIFTIQMTTGDQTDNFVKDGYIVTLNQMASTFKFTK